MPVDTLMNTTSASVAQEDNSYFTRLKVNSFVLDGVGAELAVFYLLSIFAIFFWLNQVSGKFLRVHLFLNNRQFQLIKS